MNYTDAQLKQALAKMLPEKIILSATGSLWHRNLEDSDGAQLPVLDTELLHLCWLVEDSLSLLDRSKYAWESLCSFVAHTLNFEDGIVPTISWRQLFHLMHRTWQQRIVSLAKVKGVEIV